MNAALVLIPSVVIPILIWTNILPRLGEMRVPAQLPLFIRRMSPAFLPVLLILLGLAIAISLDATGVQPYVHKSIESGGSHLCIRRR